MKDIITTGNSKPGLQQNEGMLVDRITSKGTDEETQVIDNTPVRPVYSFKFPRGYFDVLELISSEYKKVMAFWAGEEYDQYPYVEYTIERIMQLKAIIDSKDQVRALVNGPNILMELSVVHFTKRLELGYILDFCPDGDKLNYLAKYMDSLDGKAYWEQLRSSYKMHDHISVPLKLLVKMFNVDKEGREFLMDEESREFYENLPEKVIIYRAMSKKELKSKKFRPSWTLDKKVAEEFQIRSMNLYRKPRVIHTLEVPKKDILAIFLDRQEQEAIYFQK